MAEISAAELDPPKPNQVTEADLDPVAPAPQPGALRRLAESFRSAGHAIKESVRDNAAELKRAVTSPSEYFSQLAHNLREDPGGTLFPHPERATQLLRGVSDTATLGYGEKLARALDPSFAARAAEAEQKAPEFRSLGQIAGAFTPGATSAIAKGGTGLVRGLTAGIKATSVPAAAALGAARGVAGYTASAPLTAALSADAAGHRLDVAREVATDPQALALAGTLGGLGEGLGAAIQKSKGAAARRLIEEKGQGAKVGPLTPGSGGVFDRELAGVPASDKGIGTAAERGAESILKQMRQEHAVETSRPYRVLKARIDSSPAASQLTDATDLVQHMKDAIYDQETSDFAASQLEKRVAKLAPYLDPESGTYMLPERQLNGLRRTLMRAAKVGMTDAPGESEAPLRAAAFEAKKMVDQGPYAALNDLYAEGMRKLEGQRKGLGLTAKPLKNAQTDVNKARLALQRGEAETNSNTAGTISDRLAAFRAANPQFGTALDLPSLARARADLGFHLLPGHGGPLARAGNSVSKLMLLRDAILHPVATGLAVGAQNLKPLAGRVLYPLRDASATGTAAGLAQALAASRDDESATY